MSNWQKVQFTSDLSKLRSRVFIHNAKSWLKLNEIKAINVWLKSEIKLGETLIYKWLEENLSHEFLGLLPK